MTKKIEHQIYFADKKTAVLTTTDKENKQKYVTVIYDRRNLQRSSELKRNKTEDFMIVNHYHKEGYGVDESIDYTNRLMSIDEHISENKKTNREALIRLRE